ncbi:MAG: hypothetical protein JXD23_13195 [Spirochaetales bacterium]|nr:hypothetical protein [Spirochaetales bacterium]
MQKVSLPFQYPQITSYPNPAGVLSILSSDQRTTPWFANYFIQLYGDSDESGFQLHFNWNLMYPIHCPYFDYSYVKPANVPVIWRDLKEFIISAISNQYYLYLEYDWFFLRVSDCYRQMHVAHQGTVYGYDLDEDAVLIADFFMNKKYSFEKVPFDDLVIGVNYVHKAVNRPKLDKIHLLKYKYVEYKFDVELFKIQIYDYLHRPMTDYKEKKAFDFENKIFISEYITSHDTAGGRQEPVRSGNSTIRGVQNYEYLKNQIHDVIVTGDTQLDGNKHLIRNLHVFYDHKVSFALKVEYLNSIGLLTAADFEDLRASALNLRKGFLNMRNAYIKALLTSDFALLDGLMKELDALRTKDEQFLGTLIASIKE